MGAGLTEIVFLFTRVGAAGFRKAGVLPDHFLDRLAGASSYSQHSPFFWCSASAHFFFAAPRAPLKHATQMSRPPASTKYDSA
jgi:hypothetical protein